MQVPFLTEQASKEGRSESSPYFRYCGAAPQNSMRTFVKTQMHPRGSQAVLRNESDRYGVLTRGESEIRGTAALGFEASAANH